MPKTRYKKIELNHEFELDLAPLLAVMVKLVPVLLLSSAFVQLSMIETELPQWVQEGIQKQEERTQVHLIVEMNPSEGFKIFVKNPSGEDKTLQVPLVDNRWDFKTLHSTLIEIKKNNPEVFKFQFAPASSVRYEDLIRVTDEARQARDPRVAFPILNQSAEKVTSTQYMFPEVIFSNMLGGT